MDGNHTSIRHYLECTFSECQMRQFYALLIDRKCKNDKYDECTAKAKATAANEPSLEFIIQMLCEGWDKFSNDKDIKKQARKQKRKERRMMKRLLKRLGKTDLKNKNNEN